MNGLKMKKYPRIYSLSTVGIIHHHNNDYIFHPTRTDFIGDSGSGKSIIADLLQLIFVGSSVFKSATVTVKDKREPDGLVLRSPGKSTDYGYAFVNLEVNDGKFITVGAYLESNSKTTRPFIIQASLSIEQEKISPMLKPLYASDFQNEEYIFPLDEMYEMMEDRELVFKDWQRISFFHKVLYKNEILPLDLAYNDKILRDYAKIIQSFSRGKELDTSKSSSLLDFLFGQEKGKEFINKYKLLVEEIEKNAVDYGKNNQEIILLTQKCLEVSELYKALVEKKEVEKRFRTSQYLFEQRLYIFNKNKLKNELRSFIIARNDLIKLQILANHDVEHAKGTIREKEMDYEEACNIFDEWKQKRILLDQSMKLIKQLNILPDCLNQYYEQYRIQKKNYSCYKELNNKMIDSRMKKMFVDSGWKKGVTTGNDIFRKRTDELRERLSQLEVVEKLHDINNSDSLVRWALSLQRNFTKEEESLIFHFQKYGLNKHNSPKNADRYVYSPHDLLNNKQIELDNDGFWINLGGVKEFICYVAKQHLNTDRELIMKYFQAQVVNIQHEKKVLKEEFELWNNLYEIVNSLELPSRSLDVFFNHPDIVNFQEIALLNTSPEYMQQYVDILAKKDLIVQLEYKVKEEKDLLYSQLVQTKNIIKIFPNQIQRITESLETISTKIQVQKKEWDNLLLNEIFPEYKKEDYIYAENKIEFFRDELSYLENTLNKCDELIHSVANLKVQEMNLETLISEYKLLYKILPVFVTSPAISKDSVDNLKEKYIDRNAIYINQYNRIVKDFLSNEGHRFETSHDFKELIAYLLPDLFPEDMIIEEEVVERIRKRLKDINDKNRELNNKKIIKINDLLIQVKKQVEMQWDLIRRINRFFTSTNKKISGSYSMKLEKTDSVQFPIKWLSQFKLKVSLFDNMDDLFEVSILNELNTQVSIREKIMTAFREITNNYSKDVTLEELLNPNSYIELALDMKNRNGRNNKGSTGQTYAAIALLCIARLSIVGNNKGQEKGMRFMPIDEAEGLGSNFELLSDIAEKYDYQILTFSINPLGRYNEQHVYILNRNPDADEEVNYDPIEIRSRNDINQELAKFINVDNYGE